MFLAAGLIAESLGHDRIADLGGVGRAMPMTVFAFGLGGASLMGLPPMAAFPPAVAEAVAGYVALARQFRPQGAAYLENHRGHLMFVKPEERPFITADLVRLTTFAATERELKERFARLAAAGYNEVAIQILPGQEHAIEDWGQIRRAFT